MSHCTVCISTKVRLAFHVDGYAISQCDSCGHHWVSGGVTHETLAAAYGQDYYAAGGAEKVKGYEDYLRNAEARSRGFMDRLALIERHVPSRGRILDYGCALGLFVKVAADAGWDAMGYERSEWAANYGRQKLGLNIVVGDGSQPLPFDSTFDVVTMWDVVEHLDDPRRVISTASRLLRPGGLLALNTINGSSLGARLAGEMWRHIAPPYHLQYFTRSSLYRLLDDLGLDAVNTQPRGVMLGARKEAPPLRGAAAWLEDLVTHWRMAPIAGLLNLVDEIEIFAIKR